MMMTKMTIKTKIDKGLRLFSFGFILFLVIITVYEVHVTKYLEGNAESVKKWDAMHKKYSHFGIYNFIDEGPQYHPSTAQFVLEFPAVIDENEEFEDEEEKFNKGWYDGPPNEDED